MTLGEASSRRRKLQEPRLGGGKELGESEMRQVLEWRGGRSWHSMQGLAGRGKEGDFLQVQPELWRKQGRRVSHLCLKQATEVRKWRLDCRTIKTG